jgi:hypothetical protein
MSQTKRITRETRHRSIRVVSGETVRTSLGDYRGESLTIVGDGQFSCADVAAWVMEYTGESALVVSAWAIGLSEIAWLGALLARGVDVKVVIDRSFPTRKREFHAAMLLAIGSDRVLVTRCHAKILCIGGKVAIRSSANMNPNRRIEQWDIDTDQALHDALLDVLLTCGVAWDSACSEVDEAFAMRFDRPPAESDPFDLERSAWAD